ncbi:outer membrane efflux protein BepC precursor [Variibacter gotjawalensis]|uniref:Outer membrane efflux protein BepC n=1 Tax=Variibacter gotjawalensis TaxID=1333996 RepID=A0A0S3PWK8_9BRAD|nr:TolC family outer membrane protein [Variibacter gotjawalensis]NIK46151.1 outer membrane protein [Variibacter gotjawalensis]RZS48069.1 outer membrane protein [Variibacter gotjawalensis]BAT60325.1 outer membrane efflux protein BepC precursor [Variibacter gotjawalensis]
MPKLSWNARRAAVTALCSTVLIAAPVSANAETLPSALAAAYRNNPQLNAQRSQVRITDEAVPQALSGYRPQVSATADIGISRSEGRAYTGGGGDGPTAPFGGTTTPRGVGVTLNQNVFNGFRTGNRVRAAEGQVSAAREGLRVMEQQILLDGATAYMNVLRDTAILDLQRRNVEVLEEQLRQTRDRFNVGEVTRTDVAQAESRLAAARSQALGAESNLATSRASYRRVIGVEPAKLAPGMPVDRLSPRTLAGAVARGTSENPLVTSAMYGIDVALLQVKINEGALYPTLGVQVSAQQRYDVQLQSERAFSASAVAQLTIPIYQGGTEYSLIRQSKEQVGQQRLTLEQQRDQVRATVVQAWGAHEAAKAQIQAAQAQVTAAEVALNGVREEARVGQRTTLDVLNAQQELVNARVSLVTAQRDRVVQSYTLLSSTGKLSPEGLGLKIELYDSRVHYHQVRDAWIGVRTPDGR